MRKSILAGVAVIAVLAGCSEGSRTAREAHDLSEEPTISPTAAPGVAWRYSYDYQLADEAIAQVQEAHASACEALGTAKCRITGLEYRVSDDKAVYAMLQVKLAPGIARQFGKAASGKVAGAGGKLLRTQFTGEDVTPTTSTAARDEQNLKDEIAAVEKQLAAARTAEERAPLNTRLSELRSQLAGARGTIAEANERLASTPMTFNYYGRGGIEGFRTNPVEDANRSFVSSLVTMVTVVLQVFAVLLPWAFLLALLVLLARTRVGRAVRSFFAPRPAEPSE